MQQPAFVPVEVETEIEEPDEQVQVEMVVNDAEEAHVQAAESDGYSLQPSDNDSVSPTPPASSDGYSPQPLEVDDAEVAQVHDEESDGY